ncbi:MAG TPA: hypothetical protein PLK90_00110 [Clostridiales bacterium]|nr:hypothetical protein [Clostridiales bacterium]HQP68787.1 hypothetical protein [Clostridiales bacterium]
MLLKPFSNKMNISYKDFLKQNYFISVNSKGLKKVNLKGMNIISKACDANSNEIKENDIIRRSFAEMELTPELMTAEEKPFLEEIITARLAKIERNAQKDVSFYNLGAAFSIEMFDIIWLFELRSEDSTDAVNSVKEALRSTGRIELFEKWTRTAEDYLEYLENPADFVLLTQIKEKTEECVKEYEGNLFARFLLGLIYLKPAAYFDLNKAEQSIIEAAKTAADFGNSYLSALCDFLMGWISYLRSDYKKAVEYTLSAIDKEFINMPELYFSTAKYYAALNDPENSLKYLDEAVKRFDFIYAVKADVDDDFKNIGYELTDYFKKLRNDKKNSLLQKLKDLGIEFIEDNNVR